MKIRKNKQGSEEIQESAEVEGEELDVDEGSDEESDSSVAEDFAEDSPSDETAKLADTIFSAKVAGVKKPAPATSAGTFNVARSGMSDPNTVKVVALRDIDPPPVVGKFNWNDEVGRPFKRGFSYMIPKNIADRLVGSGAVVISA